MLESTFSNNQKITLYENTSMEAASTILNNRFNAMSSEEKKQLGQNKEGLWLIRESATQLGVIVIQYIHWDDNQWKEGAGKLAYLPGKGWTSDTSNLSYFLPITNDNINECFNSLLMCLPSSPHFLLKHLINPRQKPDNARGEKDEVSFETTVLTRYQRAFVEQKSNAKKREAVTNIENQTAVKVKLSAGMIQAITCELSGKTFSDPVIMNEDVKIGSIKLVKGTSYERKELEKLKVKTSKYYDNLNLKFAVNRLGCNDSGKIRSFTEERLQDPIELDTLADPHILPSGHSFSKTSIDGMITSNRSLKCPNSRQPFTQDQVVPNTNLNAFLHEWPACKKIMLEALNDETEVEEEVERKSKKRRRR